MSLNLSELQQKANQVLFNSDEAIRKWVEFISAPAGNVSFQYYDRNGNLQQVNFDNRNKLVQNFISNVNSAMSKTFYVDPINGNDANDGSQANPFKTLKKAVDSVPVGGKGIIKVKGNVVIDQDINITGKNIIIEALHYDYANQIATQTFENSTSNDSKILCSHGIGSIRIIGFDIIANDGGSTSPYWSTLFKCDHGFMYINLGRYDRSFNLNINYPVANSENGLIVFSINFATINTTLTTSTPIVSKFGGHFLYIEYSIVDNTNGTITRPTSGTIY